MWILHLFSVWGCSEIFDVNSGHKFQVLLYNLDGWRHALKKGRQSEQREEEEGRERADIRRRGGEGRLFFSGNWGFPSNIK